VVLERLAQAEATVEENHIGIYQFASNLGIPMRFIETMGYQDDFEGIKPYSVEFDQKWKDLAKDDTFEIDQHLFIRNRYYIVQTEHLARQGIHLSHRGPAVQDMIWSTSVQFGPSTSLIIRALKHAKINLDESNDEDIVRAIQDYKIEFNNQLFIRSSQAVRNGTLARAKAEKIDLIALARR
jgi:hypothetical protein